MAGSLLRFLVRQIAGKTRKILEDNREGVLVDGEGRESKQVLSTNTAARNLRMASGFDPPAVGST